MRPYAALLALAGPGLASLTPADLARRTFDTHDYYTLQLKNGQSPLAVADRLGLSYLGEVVDTFHHFSCDKGRDPLHGIQKRDHSITWSQKSERRHKHVKRDQFYTPGLHGRQAVAGTTAHTGADVEDTALAASRIDIKKRLAITDPIFDEQWHLFNAIQPGHDHNVTGVWLAGITGKNVTVSMVDDGIDMHSDDLKDNYSAEGSYDFNDHDDEPKPELSDDRHGTRCAGEIAAARNNVCGVGLAYDANISGIRILSGPISDEDEALAINYKMDLNDIYSCSWGPPDDGRSMEAPSAMIQGAMLKAIQQGRGGLGSIYVYAAGNGAASEDNCNFDGYTNSIYSITVGALDRKGQHPYYSEKCSASLVVAYSSGSGDAIHTTDVGVNSCYTQHGGTSAAAPIGAGIFALALSVRPDLSWRDMQHLCVQTSVPVDVDNPDLEWRDTYIGKKYSHTFAYGKLDAYALVEKAKDWKNVKKQSWYYSPWQHVKHGIPEGDMGLTSKFEVTEDALKKANFERLEHVTVTMNIEHERRGDLSVDLISPHGVVSHLSATRRNDDAPKGYVDWTFMSVVHWGEAPVGTWTIVVKDSHTNGKTGNFTDWRLKLWGECIDEAKAELLPMPNEHDDDDHDREDANVATTSLPPVATTTLPDHPTDHPERPVNDKIDATASATPEADRPTIVAPMPVQETTAASTNEAAAAETSSGFKIPTIFPHLPVSAKTQVWVAGALSLIVVFCVGLGVYFFIMRRRKQAADTRDNYEFTELHDTELDGAEGRARGKGRRTGGELFQAFAGESDEEGLEGLVDSDLEDSEDDDEKPSSRYRDEDAEDYDEKQRHDR